MIYSPYPNRVSSCFNTPNFENGLLFYLHTPMNNKVESFMTQTPISKRVKHFPWQHNFYDTVLVRACPYRFAKQFSQTDMPICASHRNNEIMQELFTSYMTLLTQSCSAVSTYCKNANTWHFFLCS